MALPAADLEAKIEYSTKNQKAFFKVAEIPFSIEYKFSRGFLWSNPNAKVTVRGGDIVNGLESFIRKNPARRIIIAPYNATYTLPPKNDTRHKIFNNSINEQLYFLINQTIALTGKELRKHNSKIDILTRDKLISELVYGIRKITNAEINAKGYHQFRDIDERVNYTITIGYAKNSESIIDAIRIINGITEVVTRRHYLFGIEPDEQLEGKVFNDTNYFLSRLPEMTQKYKVDEKQKQILINEYAIPLGPIQMTYLKETYHTSHPLRLKRAKHKYDVAINQLYTKTIERL